MTNPKTDRQGFSSQSSDTERDLGAKGGPTTGLGTPDGKHGVVMPYNEDLQTQITAKAGRKKKKMEEAKKGK